MAHAPKDLATYGLDKPYLRVTLPAAAAEKPATPPTATSPDKSTTILIGKPTEANPKARYAKTSDSDAVLVLPEKAITALDHGARVVRVHAARPAAEAVALLTALREAS